MARGWPVWCVCALTACTGSDDGDDDTGDDDDTPEAPSPEAFQLRFAPTVGGVPIDCTTSVGGLGPEQNNTIGLSDLRFYVSNVVFRDGTGEPVDITFDDDAFQYAGTSGWVGLVDLTDNATGSCEGTAIAFSEGTARTHEAITGTTFVDEVASISFDIGVPQLLMQEVIAENTVEGAPSPLAEMYWSWNSGYRHFVFNFTVSDGEDDGEGYVHIGSTGCTDADGELALENKDACAFVNTPSAHLNGFDLATDVVHVDLGALLAGVDFVSPVYDPDSFEIIGEQVGAECHSFVSGQPDCPPIFESLGLDPGTGVASGPDNLVFGKG